MTIFESIFFGVAVVISWVLIMMFFYKKGKESERKKKL